MHPAWDEYPFIPWLSNQVEEAGAGDTKVAGATQGSYKPPELHQ